MMQHGRYLATIEYDPDTESFYGRTVNVRPGGFDFWGTSVDELRREFAASAEVLEAFAAEKGLAVKVTTPTRKSIAATLGQVTSPEKAAAARANGKKGGRPKRNAPGQAAVSRTAATGRISTAAEVAVHMEKDTNQTRSPEGRERQSGAT